MYIVHQFVVNALFSRNPHHEPVLNATTSVSKDFVPNAREVACFASWVSMLSQTALL